MTFFPFRKSKEEYDALRKQGKEKQAGIDAQMDQVLASSREEAERLQKEKEKEEEMLSKVGGCTISLLLQCQTELMARHGSKSISCKSKSSLKIRGPVASQKPVGHKLG